MRIFGTGLFAPGLAALVDVACAAVRAEQLARFSDVEEHPGVQGPRGRPGRGAMQRKIRLGHLDDAARLLVRAHQAFSLDTLDQALSRPGESPPLGFATCP